MNKSGGGVLKDATVLLVEDNPAEQNLAKRSFEKSQMNVDLHIVDNGESALEYLEREGEYSDASASPVPDIILLDLNLPKLCGMGVIKRIRSNEKLKLIPIVVLTTSGKKEDIEEAYALGCNSFLKKPLDVADFIAVLRELGSYWLKLVVLPPKES